MNFLSALEALARHWNLISTEKYRYRCKFYGTHDDAVNQLLPRTLQNSFTVQTFLMSNKKPIGVTKNGDKISMATREYFYHCAKLQLRFRELVCLIYKDVSANFKSQTFISWLTQAAPKPLPRHVLKSLKSSIKHLEICTRIYEQTCIETILETQKEVLHLNINLMCTDQQQPDRSKPTQAKAIQN